MRTYKQELRPGIHQIVDCASGLLFGQIVGPHLPEDYWSDDNQFTQAIERWHRETVDLTIEVTLDIVTSLMVGLGVSGLEDRPQ